MLTGGARSSRCPLMLLLLLASMLAAKSIRRVEREIFRPAGRTLAERAKGPRPGRLVHDLVVFRTLWSHTSRPSCCNPPKPPFKPFEARGLLVSRLFPFCSQLPSHLTTRSLTVRYHHRSTLSIYLGRAAVANVPPHHLAHSHVFELSLLPQSFRQSGRRTARSATTTPTPSPNLV